MNLKREMKCCSKAMQDYIEGKLEMLTSEREFGFKLSESETDYMYSLTTEIAIDNYARTLIHKYL